MTVTRASAARLAANCDVPTSAANTRAAPRRRRQSVKPPVLAPKSAKTLPETSAPNSERAFSSFAPPSDTKAFSSSTRISSFPNTSVAAEAAFPFTRHKPLPDRPSRLRAGGKPLREELIEAHFTFRARAPRASSLPDRSTHTAVRRAVSDRSRQYLSASASAPSSPSSATAESLFSFASFPAVLPSCSKLPFTSRRSSVIWKRQPRFFAVFAEDGDDVFVRPVNVSGDGDGALYHLRPSCSA